MRKPKFKYGETVHIKVDAEQTPYMVTGYLIRKRSLLYECTSTDEVQFKQEFEIETHTTSKKKAGF